MGQRALAAWLRVIVVFIALMGAIVLFVILPSMGRNYALRYPQAAWAFRPYLAALWTLGAPCYAALVLFWRVTRNIALDRSFCAENARYLRQISVLALADTALCFIACGIFTALGVFHMGFIAPAFCALIAGLGVAVAAATLSHLVERARLIKEENDYTI